MTVIGNALTFAASPERISQPEQEKFVTLRVNGRGAVRRKISEGKTPVPFTGYRIRAGQFIYSRIDARNGAFAIVPADLDGAVVSKDFPVFDIRLDRADPSWLLHYFRSGVLQRRIQAASVGATNRQRVEEGVFLRFPLALPPIEEQRRVAAILSEAENVRAVRAKNADQIRALSQSLLLSRFPSAFAGASPAVRPLADWVDPARPITYGILKPGPHIADGVPYIRVADMKTDGIDLTGVRRTSVEIETAYRRSTLREGDLLISIRGHVGRLVNIPRALDGANITQDSARLAIPDPDFSTYVRAVMESSEMQHWMARRTKGAAVRGINLGDLRNAPIPDVAPDQIRSFAREKRAVASILDASVRGARLHDELFASLQSRAFRDEL